MSSPLRWLLDLIELHGKKPAAIVSAPEPVVSSSAAQASLAGNAPAAPEQPPPPYATRPHVPATAATQGLTPAASTHPSDSLPHVVGLRPFGYQRAAPVRPCPYVPSGGQTSFGWTEPQLAYYRFFASRFHDGEALEADAGYVGLFSTQLAESATTFAQLAASWERLRDAYPHIDDIGLEGRVATSRLILKNYVFDERMRTAARRRRTYENPSWIFFDLAVLAGVPPHWTDVEALVRELASDGVNFRTRRNALTVLARLRGDSASDPVLEALRGMKPKVGLQNVFAGIYALERLARKDKTGPLRIHEGFSFRAKVESFFAAPAARAALLDLFDEAAALVSPAPILAKPALPPTVAAGTAASRVPIVRRGKSADLALAPFDTLDGLLETARIALGAEAVTILALVLAMSETKPFIEGQIALSRDLREACDLALAALSVKGGVGFVKRGYHALLCGPRAPWCLEGEVPAESSALKMMQTKARFVRGLQHALTGSVARAHALAEIARIAAQRLDRDPDNVAAVFTPHVVNARQE